MRKLTCLDEKRYFTILQFIILQFSETSLEFMMQLSARTILKFGWRYMRFVVTRLWIDLTSTVFSFDHSNWTNNLMTSSN